MPRVLRFGSKGTQQNQENKINPIQQLPGSHQQQLPKGDIRTNPARKSQTNPYHGFCQHQNLSLFTHITSSPFWLSRHHNFQVHSGLCYNPTHSAFILSEQSQVCYPSLRPNSHGSASRQSTEKLDLKKKKATQYGNGAHTPRSKYFSANQRHTYTEQFQNQCRQTQTNYTLWNLFLWISGAKDHLLTERKNQRSKRGVFELVWQRLWS